MERLGRHLHLWLRAWSAILGALCLIVASGKNYQTVVYAAENQPPIAIADSAFTTPDAPVSIPVLNNDSDIDSDRLCISSFDTASSQGGTIVSHNNDSPADETDDYLIFTPAAGFAGTDTFTYVLSDAIHWNDIWHEYNDDGSQNSGSVKVENDSFCAGTSCLKFLPPDETPENRGIYRELNLSGVSSATLTFSYRRNEFESAQLKVFASGDGGLSWTTVMTITAGNDAEHQSASLDISSQASSNTRIRFEVQTTGEGNHGEIYIDDIYIDPGAPGGSVAGDSFTLETYNCDDSIYGTATALVTVNVLDNSPPSAVDDTASGDEDSIIVIDVLANDSDPDNDPLILDSFTSPSHGVTIRDQHGTPGDRTDDTIRYIPHGDYAGPDSFTYTVIDGQGGSSTANVAVTVFPINDQPIAKDDAYATNENETLTILAGEGVLENDEDVDGDILTAILETNVAHGTLTLNLDGSFTYTPAAYFSGTDSFTYTAHDAETASEVATVTITIAEVPYAPVARNDSYSLAQGSTLNVSAPGVLSNDTDPDSATLTASLVAAPAHGSLTLNPNGSFSYTPVSSFSGTDTFTYRACDNTGACASAVVSLTVVPPTPTITPSPTLTPTPTSTPTATPTRTPTPPPDSDARATRTPIPDTAQPEPPAETAPPTGEGIRATSVEVAVGSLYIRQTSEANHAYPGDTVTLEIEISNVGTAALNNVEASYTLQGSGSIIQVMPSHGTISIMPQFMELMASTLSPGQALTAQIRFLAGTEEGIITSCLSVTTTESQVPDICLEIVIEPIPPTPTEDSTPSASESAGPEEEASEENEESALPFSFTGLQASQKCLQVWGVTLTCLPVVRYILLLGGIIILGLGLCIYWPFDRDETDSAGSASDTNQQRKSENQE